MCRNELGRYLKPCIDSLHEFCDQVVVYDDASEDGSLEWLLDQGCKVAGPPGGVPRFFEHEGRARQTLLDAVVEENPTYVLAIDADEFIDNGQRLRQELERGAASLAPRSLCMQEIWTATDDRLGVRWDGAWCPHEVPVVWSPQVPGHYRHGQTWQMENKALACPRTPVGVRLNRAVYTGASILHFGWTNVQQRRERHQRYVQHDNGKHHNKKHLDSIMNPTSRVQLKPLPWPAHLRNHRTTILGAVNNGN